MEFRRYLFPSLLGGMSAAALGGAIWHFSEAGVQLNSFVGFFGSLIGAAIAVVGAVWSSDRARKLSETREVRILRKDLLALRRIVSSALHFYPERGKEWPKKFRDATQEFCAHVRSSVLIVEQAQARSKDLDFVHLAALHTLLPELRYAERWCIEVQSEWEQDPQDERDWRLVLTMTKSAIDEAMVKLKVG